MKTALSALFLASLLPVLALGACNRKGGDNGSRNDGDRSSEALPVPQAAAGSVTGMPDTPGPGQVATPGDAAPPPLAGADEALLDPLNPELGILPGGDGAGIDGRSGAEPTAQDAIAVIRDYYAAINGRSYARAYSLWSDSGNASGQSPQQFADGFADTTGATVQIGAPGEVDAAAGSRYLQLPVQIAATHDDGLVRHYAGTYTLRRSVVDGATPEQRAWRIASADLREVSQ